MMLFAQMRAVRRAIWHQLREARMRAHLFVGDSIGKCICLNCGLAGYVPHHDCPGWRPVVGVEQRTRDGRPARVESIHGADHRYPVVGVIMKDGGWIGTTWCADGKWLKDDRQPHMHDLVPPDYQPHAAPKPGEFREVCAPISATPWRPKVGTPVMTRDGRAARIVCDDRPDSLSIIACVRIGAGEAVIFCGPDGKNAVSHDNDLVPLRNDQTEQQALVDAITAAGSIQQHTHNAVTTYYSLKGRRDNDPWVLHCMALTEIAHALWKAGWRRR